MRLPRETSRPGTPAGGRCAPHRHDEGQPAVRLPGDRAEPEPPSDETRRAPRRPTRTPRCARGYAKDHPRRGFRPAYHDARGEGWHVNYKKIQRLWRE